VGAVEISGLRVRRGGRLVLDEVSARVEAGRVTGLLGPSGCGKTTLMRAIVGVQWVEAGRIDVLGRPAGVASLRRRVAYVTQAPSVYADLTPRENLAYFRRILGRGARPVAEALELVGLADHDRTPVRDLSGGERSRVSLAVALLGSPEVLVLDEPTVGLDPILRRELWAVFHALASGGAVLLVSTHVIEEADRCDELLLLRGGRLVAEGTPAELRARSGAEDLEEAFVRLAELP
jgi:ABC-2 type transport system ATP-binding protein